jgi:gamma-glutamylcyclotransferase (GGCT)/AIG2-like uncharacterized protein YtfP
MRRLYFAYGSNINLDQMRDRCEDAILIGEAYLDNHHFYINERGVANIRYSQENIVHGLLWEISEYDEDSLDTCEGARVEGKFYEKHDLKVNTYSDENLLALVYIDEYSINEGSPRSGYMDKILNGLYCSTINPEYIEKIEQKYA